MEIASIRLRRGAVIEREFFNINKDQIVVKAPEEVELELFRDEEKQEFQIQVRMFGRIDTIETEEKEEKARRRYDYLVKQLREGKAKIQIGPRISLVLEE